MNRGQLTSLIYCGRCHIPIEIHPHWKEVKCENCGKINNLVMKDFWCKRDTPSMRNSTEDEEVSYKQGLEKISTPTGINLFDIKPKITKKLNINKIKTLEDVKRVLEFLDIKVDVEEGLIRKGFDKVDDLFE